MRYKSPIPRRTPSSLSKVGKMLTQLQPHFVDSVNRSSVFSPDQKKRMVGRYEQTLSDTLDGVSRQNGIVTENTEILPDLPTFKEGDIPLQVKLEGLEDEVQYFVSLGLNIIEKLYLTNRISDDLYFKYRRLLRFIPKFHGDLIGMLEKSRKG